MTKNILLDALKLHTERAVGNILLPVAPSRGSSEPDRPAAVYKQRLPDSASAKSKAPYIIHQIVTGSDKQVDGDEQSSCTVRSVFAVYAEDEQEGSLMLLNLMERLRISLLRELTLNRQFQLDRKAGLETLVYPDDTAPYFIGEMSSTWIMPPVQIEVPL